MSSRAASGEALRRIRHALSHWHVTNYVRWKRLPDVWVRETLEQTHFSPKQVARLLHEHVSRGAEVIEQDQPPNSDFDGSLFYYIVLTLGGKEVFVKFILDPDEAGDPGILIVSAHEQGK